MRICLTFELFAYFSKVLRATGKEEKLCLVPFVVIDSVRSRFPEVRLSYFRKHAHYGKNFERTFRFECEYR